MKPVAFALTLLLVGGILPPLPTLAQSPTASAVLRGSVVRAGTNEPIRGARVQALAVSLSAGAERAVIGTTVTDDAGKFQFVNLASGVYRLSAEYQGYMRGDYGQRGRSGLGLPLRVLAGQPTADIVISLTPLGTISGRVYSSDGNPLQNANVHVLKPMYLDGRRTMLLWQQASTNEFGEYRIDSLQPGAYVVSALPRGLAAGRGETYLPIYSPGTVDIDAATTINLLPGLDYGGVDITITDRDALRIRGRVVNGLTGAPPSAVFIALAPRGKETVLGGSTSPRPISVAVDGTFEFGGIAPGSYELIATLGDGENRLAARVSVEARDRDVEDLALTLQPAFQITGRVSIDGAPSPDDAQDIAKTRVSLVQEPFIAQVSPLPVAVQLDGTFILKGVIPGDYRIRVTTEFDSFVRRASLGAADILNAAIRIDGDHGNELYIQLDRDPGALDAIVYDEKNEPAGGVQVVLAPDAPNRERLDLYRTSVTSPSGSVTFKGIEPGDYRVFSWEYIESGAWQDLTFIRRYEDLGKRVHIGERAKESTDVKLIVGRR